MFICDYLLHKFGSEQYSVEKSILIQNFTYWIQFNMVRNKSYFKRSGQYWTKFSIKELHAKYPYLKPQTIRRAIDQLIESGTIQKKYFDGRVSWFTFKDWKLFKTVLKETAESSKVKTMPQKKIKTLFFLTFFLKAFFHIGKSIQRAVKSICQIDNSYSIEINPSKIHLEKDMEGRAEKPQIETPDPVARLQKELIKRGVTPHQAVLLYQKCIRDNLKNSEIEVYFREKINQFDYLKSHAPEQFKGNPGKFLYNTVKHYISNTVYTASLLSSPEQKTALQDPDTSDKSKQEYEQYLDEQIKQYYDPLPDEQKLRIKSEVESIVARKPIKDKEFIKAYFEIEFRKTILLNIKVLSFDDFLCCREVSSI